MIAVFVDFDTSAAVVDVDAAILMLLLTKSSTADSHLLRAVDKSTICSLCVIVSFVVALHAFHYQRFL